MNILVIGGTQFVGRHMVEEALRRGHTVTLFNRGTKPNVFPQLELIKGDRDTDIDLLANRQWDAVIDTCAYFPRHVDIALDVLKDNIKSFVFISTISVYANPLPAYVTEEGALAQLEDNSTEEVTGETYGGLKVLCEQAVNKRFPSAFIVRPGFVAGPNDHTDRFTYWLKRASQGGDMLLPNPAETPLQYIDVRDLAIFTLHGLEQQLAGAFNVVINADSHTLEQLTTTAKHLSSSATSFIAMSEAFAKEQVQAAGSKPLFPLWTDSDSHSWLKVNNTKASQAGLAPRPLEDTVKDTLAWTQTWPADYEMKAGLSLEREKELLELWQKQN